jgi:hypothetical protein
VSRNAFPAAKSPRVAFPIRQEADCPVSLQVNNDRAIPLTAAHRPIVNTDDEGNFEFTPRDLAPTDDLIIGAEAYEPVYDPLGTDPPAVDRPSILYSVDAFDLVANILPVIDASGLHLVSDTGADGDTETSDARVYGYIEHADGSLEGVRIVFDHSGDDQIDDEDGFAVTDEYGRFEYLPVGIPESEQVTVKATPEERDPLTGQWVKSTSASIVLTLDPAENASPTIVSESLQLVYEVTPANGSEPAHTTNPTVTGTVANDTGVANLVVEFSHDGTFTTVDGNALTDDEGNFTYTPAGFAYGTTTLAARVVEWDVEQGIPLTSGAEGITFVFDPVTATSASFDAWGIAYVMDTSGANGVTRDPTIVGNVTFAGNMADVVVELDYDGDDVPDDRVAVSPDGSFRVTPADLQEGLINARVRIRIFSYNIALPTLTNSLSLSWFEDSQTGFSTPFDAQGNLIPDWTDDFEDDWYNQSFQRDWTGSPFSDIATPWDLRPFVLDLDAGDPLSIGAFDRDSQQSSTLDPSLHGQIAGDGNWAGLTVEIYVDGATEPAGTAVTDEDGAFTHIPQDLAPEAHTFAAKVRRPNYLTGDFTLSGSAEASLTLLADSTLPAPELDLVRWDVQGVSAIDPTIRGDIDYDGDTTELVVEIDMGADGTADASVLVGTDGTFEYTPTDLGSSATVAARVVKRSDELAYPLYGDWSTSLSWTITANQKPTVVVFRLRLDTGTTDTLDQATTDPTLVGVVSDDLSPAGLVVEFDHNRDGIVDGQATTDAAGRFVYVPNGLTYGGSEIRARVREWDPVTATDLLSVSDWTNPAADGFTALALTLVPAEAANVTSLELIDDVDPYPILQTDHYDVYDPTLAGAIADSDTPLNVTLSFYADLEGGQNFETLLGTTTPDAFGNFSFVASGLPFDQVVSMEVRATEINYLDGTSLGGGSTESIRLQLVAQAGEVTIAPLALRSPPVNGFVIDPTLEGKISVPLDGNGVPLYELLWIEFDQDEDGFADGTTQALSDGTFSYLPGGLTPDPNADVVVQARPLFRDLATGNLRFWDWLAADAFNYDPQVPVLSEDWELANDLDPNEAVKRAFEPVIVGTVISQRDAAVTLEFDYEGDGQVDDSVVADAQGAFSYTPIGLATGEVTLWVRTSQFVNEIGDSVRGDWQPLSFINQINEGPIVDDLALVDDTGDTPLSTTDPTIGGTVTVAIDNTNLGGWIVEIDQNGDGLADGKTTTDAEGAFVYTPLGLTPGEVNLRIRGVDPYSTGSPVYGAWAPFDFTLEEIAKPTLTIDLSEAADPVVAPTVAGTVTFDPSFSFVTVQFDYDGDDLADAATSIDSQGNYRYTPQGLQPGQVNLQARAVAHLGSQTIPGEWTALEEFTYTPTALPTLAELYVASFSLGTLGGRVTINGAGAPTKVEVDLDGNAVDEHIADDAVFTDANGNFTYLPEALTAGEHTLYVRGLAWDAASNAYVSGDWRDITFTYTPPDYAAQMPSGLTFGLYSNTGSSAGDEYTGDPTLSGSIDSAFPETWIEWDIATGQESLDGNYDAVSRVNPDGTFIFMPDDLSAGAVTVAARYKVWNPEVGYQSDTVWSSQVEFTLSASTNDPGTVATLDLQNQTGTHYGTPATGDATFTGTITNDGNKAGVIVEFDHDNDGVVDGQAGTREDGSFSYHIAGLTQGYYTLRARTRETDYLSGASIVSSSWQSRQFYLLAAPTIDILESATPPAGTATSDPAIDGHVVYSSGYPNVTVQLRVSENDPNPPAVPVDASVTVSVNATTGDFSYDPPDPLPGPVTVWARPVFTDPSTQVKTYGPWSSLAFTFAAAISQDPTVTDFQIYHDTATSGDGETADPTVSGTVEVGAVILPFATVDIRVKQSGDIIASTRIQADAQGNFAWTPIGLPANTWLDVEVQASAVNPDTLQPYSSSWTSLPAPSGSPPGNLKLLDASGPGLDDGLHYGVDPDTGRPTISGQLTDDGRIAGRLIEFDHNDDDVPDGSTYTKSDGSFVYFPTGLVDGVSVTIEARAPEVDYSTGQQSAASLAFAWPVTFTPDQDVPGKPQLDPGMTAALAPNTLADQALQDAVNTTLAEAFSASDTIDVRMGAVRPLFKGNSQIADGDAITDRDTSPFVVSGTLPSDETSYYGPQSFQDTDNGRTLDSEYSWSYSVDVDEINHTVSIATTFSFSYSYVQDLEYGESQGFDTALHDLHVEQEGAYSFAYYAEVEYEVQGSTVVYTDGTSSLTETSDYQYDRTDTVTLVRAAPGDLGTSSATDHTDGRYYYLYKEEASFDGNAPTAPALGTPPDFTHWENHPDLHVDQFASLPTGMDPLDGAATGSFHAFSFAEGRSVHAYSGESGSYSFNQPDLGASGSGSYAGSDSISYTGEIVGTGVYATDDGDFWATGVRALSASGSRTSAGSESASFHAVTAIDTTDGTGTDSASLNYGVTLAVITTYAVSGTVAGGADGLVSDNFIFQDDLNVASASAGSGSVAADYDLGATHYEGDDSYDYGVTSSFGATNLAIGDFLQSTDNGVTHTFLSVGYVTTANSAATSAGNESGGFDEETTGESTSSENSGTYHTHFDSSASGNMLDIGSAMGPDDQVTAQGKVIATFSGESTGAYGGDGDFSASAGDQTTAGDWSLGQWQTGGQSGTQDYSYINSPGQFTATGTRTFSGDSSVKSASQSSGSVTDTSGQQPVETHTYRDNLKSTQTNSLTDIGSFTTTNGVEDASGDYIQQQTTDSKSTSFVRDQNPTPPITSATSLTHSASTESSNEKGHYTIEDNALVETTGTYETTADRATDSQIVTHGESTSSTGDTDNGTTKTENVDRTEVAAYTATVEDKGSFAEDTQGRESHGTFFQDQVSRGVVTLTSDTSEETRFKDDNLNQKDTVKTHAKSTTSNISKVTEDSTYSIVNGTRTAEGDIDRSNSRRSVADTKTTITRTPRAPAENEPPALGSFTTTAESTVHAIDRDGDSFEGTFVLDASGATWEDGTGTVDSFQRATTSGFSKVTEKKAPVVADGVTTKETETVNTNFGGTETKTYWQDGAQTTAPEGTTVNADVISTEDRTNSSLTTTHVDTKKSSDNIFYSESSQANGLTIASDNFHYFDIGTYEQFLGGTVARDGTYHRDGGSDSISLFTAKSSYFNITDLGDDLPPGPAGSVGPMPQYETHDEFADITEGGYSNSSQNEDGTYVAVDTDRWDFGNATVKASTTGTRTTKSTVVNDLIWGYSDVAALPSGDEFTYQFGKTVESFSSSQSFTGDVDTLNGVLVDRSGKSTEKSNNSTTTDTDVSVDHDWTEGLSLSRTGGEHTHTVANAVDKLMRDESFDVTPLDRTLTKLTKSETNTRKSNSTEHGYLNEDLDEDDVIGADDFSSSYEGSASDNSSRKFVVDSENGQTGKQTLDETSHSESKRKTRGANYEADGERYKSFVENDVRDADAEYHASHDVTIGSDADDLIATNGTLNASSSSDLDISVTAKKSDTVTVVID